MKPDERLVVLESFPTPRATTNPYIVQLAQSIRAEPDMQLFTFSWRRALFGRYQVFHLHWPEVLIRGRSLPKSVGRRWLTRMLLARLRMSRIPLVRTVHNIDAHDGVSRAESGLLARIDRAATARILLTSRTPVDENALAFVIPHGHYRAWYSSQKVPRSIPGRLAHVGLIKPYKGVSELVAVFNGLDDSSLSLFIGGSVPSPQFEQELLTNAGADARITLIPRFLSEQEIAEIVGSSSLVVLPYREMHNSGAAILALSLDRPVLVPRNPVTEDLAAEVGPGWVSMIDGELSANQLRTAVSAGIPSGRPDLSAREWKDVGRAHRGVFIAAIDAAANH